MIEESLFYPLATVRLRLFLPLESDKKKLLKDLYNNLTYMYPYSNIWVIGHSLGGALAAMIGTTFGPPVVAFQSPGEKRAAARLHLPLPVSGSLVCNPDFD
jgi:lipase ATG15